MTSYSCGEVSDRLPGELHVLTRVRVCARRKTSASLCGVRGPLERDRETRTWPDWLAGWVRNASARSGATYRSPRAGPQTLRALPCPSPVPSNTLQPAHRTLPSPATPCLSHICRLKSGDVVSFHLPPVLCPGSLFSTSLQSTTPRPRTFPTLLGYIEQAPYPFTLRRSLKSTAEDPGSYNRRMGTAKTEEDAMEPLWS